MILLDLTNLFFIIQNPIFLSTPFTSKRPKCMIKRPKCMIKRPKCMKLEGVEICLILEVGIIAIC